LSNSRAVEQRENSMMLKKMTEGRDPNTGRFLAGNNGGGRQKGSRNKLAEDFISDLYASWQKNGAAAIERMLAERPAEYVKVVASILPKQLEIKENTFDGISDEQLDQLLAAARTALNFRHHRR
jgi:hypothetical protein